MMSSIPSSKPELIQIGDVPQYVPGATCLRCDVCCRFPEANSFLRPYFTSEEIDRAIIHGLSSSHFPDRSGSQIQVVPNSAGEGYVCPAFDTVTSKCRIYDDRPLDCQIYPLAVMWSADGNEVLLGWDAKCPFLRAGEGLEAWGKGQDSSLTPHPSRLTLAAYAENIAALIERDDIVTRLEKHPRFIGPFQGDVVVLRTLSRLTDRLNTGQGARGRIREVSDDLGAKPQPSTLDPQSCTSNTLAACSSPLASSIALRPFTLADRSSFDDALASVETPLSAYAFAPHYVWRDHFIYRWSIIADHLCLFAEYGDGLYMPLPPLGPGPLQEPIAQAFALMRQWNRGSAVSRIENVPEELATALERLGYRLTPKEPDYLYRVSDLARLAGDRYKSQRAACNRLIRTRRVSYRSYHDGDQEACLTLFDLWAAQQKARDLDGVARHMLDDAASAHREAMTAHDALGLVGRVVQVDDDIRAYTFGYPRSSSAFCVLLEVADRTVNGLAQFIFRELCREAMDCGYSLMNTMDDSGLESLRVSKRAYKPLRLITNYIVSERSIGL